MDLDTLASRLPSGICVSDFDRDEEYLEVTRPVLLQDLLRSGDYLLDLSEDEERQTVTMRALMDDGDVFEFWSGPITHNGRTVSHFLFVREVECALLPTESSAKQASTLGISQSWADATCEAFDRLCAVGSLD